MSAIAIRLSPADNVVVCCRTVEPGERFTVDGHTLAVTERVELGHKLALTPLAAGDKVLKYGMPIGSMTEAADAGAWIHLHNMKSDYMPAHLRDAAGDHA
ncbi:altronate hydrolase [Sphingomonas spermidinifaciens]|uniref:Altronate hydrolase n=1 Tax=Sphingomonas spermidinifaciens TaxID=1141889 RepID=A0A2A4B0R7_9SPHN|nr:UxaA family hydrolase [Sphingomonas spermidinifaciens]PCD02021.1 altronate hydrolase [Sphingomonas spermidinifaciens]